MQQKNENIEIECSFECTNFEKRDYVGGAWVFGSLVLTLAVKNWIFNGFWEFEFYKLRFFTWKFELDFIL